MADEDRKLFIDEDWKAQVQREREEAERKAQESGEPAPEGEQQGGPTPPQQEGTPFMALVQSLATQCLLSLGVIAPKDVKEVYVDLGQARLLVDMLVDLRAKTEGNLAAEEQAMLDETVSELQRIFMMRSQQAQDETLREAGIRPEDLGKKPE
jgi:hypothetical protein